MNTRFEKDDLKMQKRHLEAAQLVDKPYNVIFKVNSE